MYLARFYVYSVAAQGNLEALLARALQECPMSAYNVWHTLVYRNLVRDTDAAQNALRRRTQGMC